MRQRKSLELYPLTMCYFIIRTQKCTKLFFNHYLVDYVRVIYTLCLYGNQIAMRIQKIGDEKLLI